MTFRIVPTGYDDSDGGLEQYAVAGNRIMLNHGNTVIWEAR